MTSSKTFAVVVKPRDVLVDIKGLPDYATNAYLRFWMLHALHGEPLPPREEKKPRDEWDAWFRDKLDMKNVRTWIKARDELLRLSKIRMTDDGRLYIGRTMRDAEKRRGGDPSKWSGDDDPQSAFDLGGVHWAQTAEGRAAHGPTERPVYSPVDIPVDVPGKLAGSPEVPPNIGRTSPDVRQIWRPKSLILNERRPLLSCSWSYSDDHESVAAVPFGSARARAVIAGAWARAGPSPAPA